MDELKIKTTDRIFQVHLNETESYRDVLYDDVFILNGGNIYGIVGEIGSGGWALSYLLSGKAQIENEEVDINGRKISKNEVIRNGWYVGNEIIGRGFNRKNRTIRKQIELGLHTSKKNSTVEEIIDRFELTKERLDYPLYALSREKWRASLAIGYAYDKQIFCFPYLDTCTLSNIIIGSGMMHFFERLKDEGGCIIIPTAQTTIVELIADHLIQLNNPRFNCKNFAEDCIKRYRSYEVNIDPKMNSVLLLN